MNCKVVGKVAKHHTMICRVCLRNVNKRTSKSVFQDFMNLPIYRHILSIVAVNIKVNDGFPDKICCKCLEELKVAVCFKKKCEENDMILRTSAFKTSAHNTAEIEATEIMYTQVYKEEPGDTMSLDDKNFDACQTLDTKDHNSPKCEDDMRRGSTKFFDSTKTIDEETRADDKTHQKDLVPKALIKSKQTVEMFYDTIDDQKPLVPKSEDKDEEDLNNFDTSTTHGTEIYVTTNDDYDHSEYVAQKPQFKSKAIDLNLQCDDCKDYFRTKCKLRVHWKKVHMKQKLTCEWCKRDFKEYKSYHKHRKNRPINCKEASNFRIEGSGKSRIIYCKECNYNVKAAHMQYMIKHKYTHSGEKSYSCEKCGKSYTQAGPLIAHRETAHGEYKIEITCQYCGKIVRGRTKVYQHLQTHISKNLKCKICSKILKNKKTFAWHMLRHTGIKNYQCELCAETFFTPSNLYLHKRKHFGDNYKHECNVCGYKTDRKSLIVIHRSKHVGDNVACKQCGMFFDSKQKLRDHERRHNEKNHVCDHCNRHFYRKDNLRKHIKLKHKIRTPPFEVIQEKKENPKTTYACPKTKSKKSLTTSTTKNLLHTSDPFIRIIMK